MFVSLSIKIFIPILNCYIFVMERHCGLQSNLHLNIVLLLQFPCISLAFFQFDAAKFGEGAFTGFFQNLVLLLSSSIVFEGGH